ncbi:platelet glycoprotein 4 isoform X1 [Protobothrops mucrosquamatus]|uniref:platelet glycoprotein 4 isoform X1 n=1 Tax=Protobothrops mucrosquamatus TaxID=103944 RepID=UPI000775A400|nr:platelet glycoprotein 4 isoform X1 [Protobothrops mucrosquamatus]
MGCNRNCGLLTGTIIGAALAILGGILIPVGNNLIEDTVKKETVIEKGTTAYENFVVAGSPIYRQFWLFDVQNPEDVMANGSAPILQQKGPYTYRMRYKPKEKITEHEDGTLSYFQRNIFLFEPEMSVGTENDNVTTVNLAVVAAPVLYPDVVGLLNMFIQQSKSKFLQTRTVKEILWGYEDPFLKSIPIQGIDKVVGVFYPFNDTSDGPYRIYSGKNNISQTGIIHSYKNNRTLEYWQSYCAMVNGTDAASFHPFVDKSDVLYFFSADICRSISAIFDTENTVKEILLYRFPISPKAFASLDINPDNICFCTEMELSRNCSLRGILDVSSCKGGKPVYITLPHFLEASEELFQFVEGLKPNMEEHMTFVDVEPITGLTMHFAKRLQINLLVQPNSKITVLKNIKQHFLFPILWLNETAVISDEKAELFRSKVTDKIKLLNIMQILLITLGCVMFLGFLIAFFACRRKTSK